MLSIDLWFLISSMIKLTSAFVKMFKEVVSLLPKNIASDIKLSLYVWIQYICYLKFFFDNFFYTILIF